MPLWKEIHTWRPLPKTRTVYRTVAILAVTASGIAQADDIQTRIARNETVESRPHPETDALGIRAGSFLIFPKASAEDGINDNIYASHSSTVTDSVATLATRVSAQSDWTRNFIQVTASDSQSLYAVHRTEDTNDYGTSLTGRLDVTNNDRVTLNGSYSFLHTPRSSPDNTFGKTPGAYSIGKSDVASFDKFNRLSVNSDSIIEKDQYTDVATSLGGFTPEKDQNRWEYTESLRFGYEIVPEYEAVLRGSVNDRSFIHAADSAGYRHNSLGGDVTAGLAFDLTGMTFGEVGLGYMSRRYQDPRFSPIQGMSGLISLTWNATPLMTVKLNGSRSIDETVIVGASGVVNSTVSLAIDHELLRQLILSARMGATQADYRGIPQHQATFIGDFGAAYRMNRTMNLTMKYSRTNVDSNNELYSFTQNIAIVRFSLQM